MFTRIIERARQTVQSLIVLGLTASRLVATSASKALSSVTDLTAWIAGTSNQITVTDDGDGTVTLSTPQDIGTASAPLFLANVASKNTDATLTASECKGYMILVTATATITLPAVAIGYLVTIYSTTAAAVYVDPNDNDRIILDGVALDDGDKLTSASGAGDYVTLIGDSAAGWTVIGRSGTWTDGS